MSKTLHVVYVKSEPFYMAAQTDADNFEYHINSLYMLPTRREHLAVVSYDEAIELIVEMLGPSED